MSSIGPQNGISYTVLSTSRITKPDATNCGFNDIGLPNPASYSREVRQYSEYLNGTLTRSWQETVDTFSACINV
jgi:hypothetical protein